MRQNNHDNSGNNSNNSSNNSNNSKNKMSSMNKIGIEDVSCLLKNRNAYDNGSGQLCDGVLQFLANQKLRHTTQSLNDGSNLNLNNILQEFQDFEDFVQFKRNEIFNTNVNKNNNNMRMNHIVPVIGGIQSQLSSLNQFLSPHTSANNTGYTNGNTPNYNNTENSCNNMNDLNGSQNQMSTLENEILMKQVQLQQSQQLQQSSIFSLLGDTWGDQPTVLPTTNSFVSVELFFSCVAM